MATLQKTTLLLIAFMALLAATCTKPPERDYVTQKQPRRPGETTPTPPPEDSVNQADLERWIWIGFGDYSPGCAPVVETYNPPANFYGQDSRAWTLNWKDSTYHCEAFVFHPSGPGITSTVDWHTEISGKFSVKKVGEYGGFSIIFDHGVNIRPFFSEWETSCYDGDMDYASPYFSQEFYVQQHPGVPRQFVIIGTGKYQGAYGYHLKFIVLNPHTDYSNQNRIIL